MRTRKKLQKHNYRVTYADGQARVKAVTTNAYNAKCARELVMRDFVDCVEILTVKPEFLFS